MWQWTTWTLFMLPRAQQSCRFTNLLTLALTKSGLQLDFDGISIYFGLTAFEILHTFFFLTYCILWLYGNMATHIPSCHISTFFHAPIASYPDTQGLALLTYLCITLVKFSTKQKMWLGLGKDWWWLLSLDTNHWLSLGNHMVTLGL